MGAIAGRQHGAVGPADVRMPPHSRAGHVLGMDLGGTYLRAALADKEGKVLAKRRVQTLAHEGRDAVLNRIVTLLKEVEREAHRDVAAVGLAAPGPLDPKAGVVRNAPTLPGWVDVPLTRIVEERVGVPAILANDASAAALGEFAYGAGRGARHLVYLTISTGIGGGFVVDSELLEGQKGAAGEAGHVIVDPEGPRCSCGGRGHLEAVASGTAVGRQAREAIGAGEGTLLKDLSDGEPERVTSELVHKAALAGDRFSAGLLGAAGRNVGYALVGFVHLFNPEVIVLGGGVTNAGGFFWDPLREVLGEGLMPVFGEGLRLEKSSLEDAAGLYGAAALALHAVRGAEAVLAPGLEADA